MEDKRFPTITREREDCEQVFFSRSLMTFEGLLILCPSLQEVDFLLRRSTSRLQHTHTHTHTALIYKKKGFYFNILRFYCSSIRLLFENQMTWIDGKRERWWVERVAATFPPRSQQKRLKSFFLSFFL